jgi:hypothetical protein
VAIRRCPYCKAIIDESQKYCNNCGTQLLFPEDEETADEDIKGEKILDDDTGPSSEEQFEASLESPPGDEAEAELEKEEIDLEEALQGGSFPGEEPAAAASAEDWGEIKIDPDAVPADEEVPLDEGVVKSAEEVLGDLSGASLGLADVPAGVEDVEKDRPVADGLDFEAKGEIVQLLAELEKRKAESPEAAPGTGGSTPGSEDLPPWAELVKEGAGAVPAGAGEEPAEGLSEAPRETAPSSSGFAPGDTMDFEKDVLRRVERLRPESSTMGIPESVGKAETPPPVIPPAEEKAVEKPRFLPGEEDLDEDEVEEELGLDLEAIKAEAEEAEGEVDAAAEEDAGGKPAAVEEPAYVPPQKLGLLGSLKAFLFDTVFVGLFWFVAVGLAARLMKVGLFALIREASLSLGILFFALWGGYFFLFLFFLGETLGRRLSSAKD